MNATDVQWIATQEAMYRIFRTECDRSGLLHCPCCDEPVVDELNNVVAMSYLLTGKVPLHPHCVTRQEELCPQHWWEEDFKERARLLRVAAEEARDTFLDWAERHTEEQKLKFGVNSGPVSHCPVCDLPFDPFVRDGLNQFEAGHPPGHPRCALRPQWV